MTNLTAVRGERAENDSAGVVVALEALSAGRPVVFVDEGSDCGYLAQPAAVASVDFVVLAATHGTGTLRVAAGADRLDALGVPTFGDGGQRVPVDLAGGGPGGLHDHRAATIRALADPATQPADLVAPGHVFPEVAGECRSLESGCPARAMLDAVRLAGHEPLVAYTQLVDEQGHTADRMATARLARRLGLVSVSIRDALIRREQLDPAAERIVNTTIPTPEGRFDAVGFRGLRSGEEYVAFVAGPVSDGVRVHVHRRCMISDVFGGVACGCGEALRAALAEIRHSGSGVVIYRHGADEAPCVGEHEARREAGWAKTVEVAAVVRDLGARRVFLSATEIFDHDVLRALGLEAQHASGDDWFRIAPAQRAAGL
ncbi:MAG: 3,4-dihydroxy-2-butanone-4-phosphate synthase [Solirubrobacteraceae bacterium]